MCCRQPALQRRVLPARSAFLQPDGGSQAPGQALLGPDAVELRLGTQVGLVVAVQRPYRRRPQAQAGQEGPNLPVMASSHQQGFDVTA